MPLLGGTLVPAANLVAGGFTDAQGAHTESFAWPSGVAPASPFYTQFLVLDPAASEGVAFSNALRLRTAP